jgi:hypothetical protein
MLVKKKKKNRKKHISKIKHVSNKIKAILVVLKCKISY